MIDEYQARAFATACYGDNVEYPFMALAEEAGEVLGKINKFMRKHNCTANDAILGAGRTPAYQREKDLREDLIKELGDAYWNISACCVELDISIEELQESNLEKLAGRVKNNTIVGSGDNR